MFCVRLDTRRLPPPILSAPEKHVDYIVLNDSGTRYGVAYVIMGITT